MIPGLVRDVPVLQVPGSAGAMIAVGTSQVGYREGPGNATFFGEWYGMPGAAWCAMFQSWAAVTSGATMVPKFAYTPTGADWFRDAGQWGSTPRVGALGFVYSERMGRIHHVFQVVRLLAPPFFITIEGNTSSAGSATGDGVYMLRRSGVGGAPGGYGYPAFKPGTPALPLVSLANLIDAARRDPAAAQGATTHPPMVTIVEKALVAEKLLDPQWVDGSFGSRTVVAYAKWQRSVAGGAYTGNAADGIPGRDSLTRLGKRHGFRVGD